MRYRRAWRDSKMLVAGGVHDCAEEGLTQGNVVEGFGPVVVEIGCGRSYLNCVEHQGALRSVSGLVYATHGRASEHIRGVASHLLHLLAVSSHGLLSSATCSNHHMAKTHSAASLCTILIILQGEGPDMSYTLRTFPIRRQTYDICTFRSIARWARDLRLR